MTDPGLVHARACSIVRDATISQWCDCSQTWCSPLRDRAFAPLSELWHALNPDGLHHSDMDQGVVNAFISLGALLGYELPEVYARKDMPISRTVCGE